MKNLEPGDTGEFSELSLQPNPSGLIVAYNPPIEALLERAQQIKGSDLSLSEVTRIRNAAPAIALPKEVYEKTYGN